MRNNLNEINEVIKLHKSGEFEKANLLLFKILKENKNNSEIYKLIAVTELQLGNNDKAIMNINKAIQLNDKSAEYFLIRGFSNMKLKNYKVAIEDFEKCIEINPNLSDAYLNIGVSLSELKDLEKSLDFFSKVIKQNPNDYRAHMNKAYIKAELNDVEGALIDVNNSISVKDDNLNSYLLRGNFYKDLSDFKNSMKDYDKVISESKNRNNKDFFYDASYNKALLNLLQGHFKDGWELYENRFNTKQHTTFQKFKESVIFNKKISQKIPFLNNLEQIKNNNLLVISEQGIGEHIIYLPLVLEASKIANSVTMLIEPRLIALCKRSFKNINFIPFGTTHSGDFSLFDEKKFNETNYDYQVAVASLPKFFRSDKKDFKNTPKGFFKVDLGLKKQIFNELNLPKNKKIVGISWKSFNSQWYYFKNIELKQLGKIFDKLNISLVNLQYGDVQKEINEFVKKTNIPIIQVKSLDNREDLDGLVALIDLCDLIVSTDNVTIQLSGSINKETWALIPHVPHFFYQLNRSDCIWYPSITLYRQQKRADWTGILTKMKKELIKRYV